MNFSAIRKAPLQASWAAALMLGCAVLPAQAGWFSSDDKPAQKTEKQADSKAAAQQPAGDRGQDAPRGVEPLRAEFQVCQ